MHAKRRPYDLISARKRGNPLRSQRRTWKVREFLAYHGVDASAGIDLQPPVDDLTGEERMKASRYALASLLLAFAGAVSAQQAPPSARAPAQNAPAQNAPAARQQLTPEQQAQVARQDAEMTSAATRVVQMVDQNKAAEVWAGASPVAKGVVALGEFVRQVALDRQKLGAVAERKQLAVTRAVYPQGGQVPAGNYVNVVYVTRFANSPQPVRELVSFHLDDDKIWRVSGYSVR
jgi:hypothetical protein